MNWILKKSVNLTGIALVSMAFLVSCDVASNTDDDVRKLKITMTAGEESSYSLYKGQTSDWTDTSKVELTEIKLLVDDLELENISDDSLDFEVDDLVVNLPLNGDTLELTDQDIPAGSYDKLDLEIDSDDVDDPDLNDGEHRYSIVVRGMYNGEEFVFRSKREYEKEFKFHPPIQVTDTTSSITLNLALNVERWFKHADPTNPDHQSKIEYNIKKSLRAFCRYGDGKHWYPDDGDHDDDWDDDHDDDHEDEDD